MAEVVILSGVKETLAALKNFDKSAVRKFNKVVNRELSLLQNEARSLVPSLPPMSGWRSNAPLHPRRKRARNGAGWPMWNAGEVMDGITKTRAEGKVSADYTTSAGAIFNKSAPGKIFEGAGYSNKERRVTTDEARTSGGQFKRTLSNRFGKASRLTWFVAYQNREISQREVAKALEEAKAELRRELDRPNPWTSK